MSATDTAILFIDWVLTGAGPPPTGDLRAADALIRPADALKAALAQLGAVTVARLRMNAPMRERPGALGAGDAVLAAALGALPQTERVRLLLQAVPTAEHPVQWLTRHGLMHRVLPLLSDDRDSLLDDLLQCSPLTALLWRPAAGRHSEALAFAQTLLPWPAGRRLLQFTLAEPAPDLAVRAWRRELLERLRLAAGAGAEFVVDVYETRLIHHHDAVLTQVRDARAVLTDRQAAADETRLRDALAVAYGWESLWAVERSQPELLRARRYLGYGYREGLALYRLARRLTHTVSR
jgi:hypothetical protein